MKNLQCPKCNESKPFDSFGINPLTEGAVMVCPVCSAEFALSATLTKSPGEEGQEAQWDVGTQNVPPASPDMPKRSAPPPDMGGGAPPQDMGMEALRTPVLEPRVLECSACKAAWVGFHAKSCPKCKSEQVMVSAKTIEGRAADAILEVENGVPISRAVNKMLGKFTRTK